MSREIKFRAWDKEDQVMDWPTEISWDDGGDIQNVDAYHKKMTNNFVLEQFTSLKDKNGKDIYENDIVQNEQGQQMLINYKSGCFLVGNYYFGSIGAGKILEVIGDIHKNPELLEVENDK
ncbi:YopX family protein [Lentilactobacillus buchneri]|uniref:YopX protein domain-containing protein n=1 Tax=Lentilactobacillus buchneri subsp. silagei CD034 TaxID=1071400 RepID=J9W2T7_LENBU|nr:YopX family protein [Lentilactobacillus buchneri]AFR99981.1 hypothetical protein LBUCD034_0935 [Lentilactobacillus buchneri subsp. silagei CD034]